MSGTVKVLYKILCLQSRKYISEIVVTVVKLGFNFIVRDAFVTVSKRAPVLREIFYAQSVVY